MNRNGGDPRMMSTNEGVRNPAAIDHALRALAAGELVVMPTDTVYGLAADPRVPGARDRLYAAKQRDRGKPIPVLVRDLTDAERRGAVFSARARGLARRFWPGPLTLVVPAGEGFEGYRMPRHPIAQALIAGCGGALYVTSANVSGQPSALTAREAISALGSAVRTVVEEGPPPDGRESSVVRVAGDTVEILREGALSRSEIESCPTD